MSLKRQYQDDGVVLLEGALGPAALAQAEAAYNWSFANPGPGATRFKQATDATFLNDLYNPRCLEGYRAMLEASPLPELIADVWGADDVWFFYEQVFLKEGGETRRTPWHQDSSYLAIAGQRRSGFAFAHNREFSLGPGRPALISSYHPSQQNTQTGRLTFAMFREVFAAAVRMADEAAGRQKIQEAYLSSSSAIT